MGMAWETKVVSMNIAIDISPLKSGNYLQHRVRGSGFYLQNLRNALEKNFPENKYLYFTRGEKLNKNVSIVHYPYFEPFFITLPLFFKNKTVVTVHDLTPLVFPDHFEAGFRGKIKWQIQKRALQNADAIITDSESSKKDIVKYTGIASERIRVVYLAAGSGFKVLNSGEKINKIKTKYGLPDKFVLYVGDATWNKNLPRLIEAVSRVDIPLVMTGKALVSRDVDVHNPWNKDLVKVQKMAAKNKKIFRLGFVSEEDLVTLYNAATLFTMPSLYEGFGLPVLEAMACGCPVVTSKNGSLIEIVGDAAKFVDSEDIDGMAKTIKEVFDNRTLQKELSQKGLTQCAEFSWKKTAEDTMKVYRDVIFSE